MPTPFYLTTAIDYPNSRPHVGTAFEKLGADVQARYRRMQGRDVLFLMGNDENTLKVAERAAELGEDPHSYCDRMAGEFRQVWDALHISYDVFVQTSHPRHRDCCAKFVQKVYDNGHIYKGEYSGWYCPGCEEFKSEKVYDENAGQCPNHLRPLVRRSEPCYYFKLSAFRDRLLELLRSSPQFVQPDSRRNEMIGFIENEGLADLNISRQGETWGVPLPFDPAFTSYVWFDALLTYLTGIGYGDDRATFDRYWPAAVHFIGKDITRFHAHIWPAMLWAAGEALPAQVYSHGFITVEGQKMSKALGNVIDPLAVIARSSVDAYRYYFLRECPFPGDGDFSEKRFHEVVNAELSNNLGNMLSRCITLTAKNYGGVLPNPKGLALPCPVAGLDLPAFVAQVRHSVETCQYSLALQAVVQQLLTPTNQYLEAHAPWKLVKTDPTAAAEVLVSAAYMLRVAAILLKPFIPTSAAAVYRAFDFGAAWEGVSYDDAAVFVPRGGDLRVTAELEAGKVRPLFPRLG